MAILRGKFSTHVANPALDAGTAITGTGGGFTGLANLTYLAGGCDGLPTLPSGFPAQNDPVEYANKVAYFDPVANFGRSERVRSTVGLINGTGQSLAAAIAGWTNLKFAIDAVWIDGDYYAGFPLGGGGVGSTYGFQMELRLASGAVAGSSKTTGPIFADGNVPPMTYVSLAATASEWTVSEAQLANAGFGVNWFIENNPTVDSADLTPNLGMLALGFIVTGDPPAGVGAKLATHPVAVRLGLSL